MEKDSKGKTTLLPFLAKQKEDSIISFINSVVSYINKYNGFFIFIATLALAIITFFYLRETQMSRKLLEDETYRRSLPVLTVIPDIEDKDNKLYSDVKIYNYGATAFEEQIILFWVDGNKLIFDDRAYIEENNLKIPYYRLRLNHTPSYDASSRHLERNMTDIIKRIENQNEFYMVILIKYKVPFFEKCPEIYSYKFRKINEESHWTLITHSKMEELYNKAKACDLSFPHCLLLSETYSDDANLKEKSEEIKGILKSFFNPDCK